MFHKSNSIAIVAAIVAAAVIAPMASAQRGAPVPFNMKSKRATPVAYALFDANKKQVSQWYPVGNRPMPAASATEAVDVKGYDNMHDDLALYNASSPPWWFTNQYGVAPPTYWFGAANDEPEIWDDIAVNPGVAGLQSDLVETNIIWNIDGAFGGTPVDMVMFVSTWNKWLGSQGYSYGWYFAGLPSGSWIIDVPGNPIPLTPSTGDYTTMVGADNGEMDISCWAYDNINGYQRLYDYTAGVGACQVIFCSNQAVNEPNNPGGLGSTNTTMSSPDCVTLSGGSYYLWNYDFGAGYGTLNYSQALIRDSSLTRIYCDLPFGLMAYGDDLDDSTARPVQMAATFEIRDSTNTVIDAQYAAIFPDGSCELTVPTSMVPGNDYTVWIQYSHWLGKATTFTYSGSDVVITLDAINGNIVNSDNVVDLGDFDALAAAFGSAPGDGNWNVMADLDHNDVVDLGDFDQLAAGFGNEGDY